ncbi:MAG TPA: metal-sensing transcriptional repressor [Actinomycetota bacterium]|nr:metal-sensing transcriptional repressor [Actinomycetota bacterium]
MENLHRQSVINRLRTARGDLDAVLHMVEEDAYCRDGRGAEIVDELMEALRYEPSVTGPTPESPAEARRREEQPA